jgi:hypothetical protein
MVTDERWVSLRLKPVAVLDTNTHTWLAAAGGSGCTVGLAANAVP